MQEGIREEPVSSLQRDNGLVWPEAPPSSSWIISRFISGFSKNVTSYRKPSLTRVVSVAPLPALRSPRASSARAFSHFNVIVTCLVSPLNRNSQGQVLPFSAASLPSTGSGVEKSASEMLEGKI